MKFQNIKRSTISHQVAETVRDAIVSGAYVPGDPLPTERALADEFGINRSSVREALRQLESWGLVEIRHGAGARVSDFLSTAGLQLLPFLLAPGGRLDPKLLFDLLELRVELLGFTAGHAANRADPPAIQELAACLGRLEAATDVEDVQVLDYAFFQQLVVMSGNRVLALLSNAIARVYLENRALFSMMYVGGLDTGPHRRTLEAVGQGDATGARAAMAEYGASALGRLR